jgi:hypothetical protein
MGRQFEAGDDSVAVWQSRAGSTLIMTICDHFFQPSLLKRLVVIKPARHSSADVAGGTGDWLNP